MQYHVALVPRLPDEKEPRNVRLRPSSPLEWRVDYLGDPVLDSFKGGWVQPCGQIAIQHSLLQNQNYLCHYQNPEQCRSLTNCQ